MARKTGKNVENPQNEVQNVEVTNVVVENAQIDENAVENAQNDPNAVENAQDTAKSDEKPQEMPKSVGIAGLIAVNVEAGQKSVKGSGKYQRVCDDPDTFVEKDGKMVPFFDKWVWRDKDVETFHIMKEYQRMGYNVKVCEQYRQSHGELKVVFLNNGLWCVTFDNLTQKFLESVEGQEFMSEYNEKLGITENNGEMVFDKVEINENRRLVSSEKRHCQYCAKYLAIKYKLAYNAEKDTAKVDKSVLTSSTRRMEVYKPPVG